jgi:hypothetical protein
VLAENLATRFSRVKQQISRFGINGLPELKNPLS